MCVYVSINTDLDKVIAIMDVYIYDMCVFYVSINTDLDKVIAIMDDAVAKFKENKTKFEDSDFVT